MLSRDAYDRLEAITLSKLNYERTHLYSFRSCTEDKQNFFHDLIVPQIIDFCK